MPELPDTPRPDGADRYAIYVLRYEEGKLAHRRLCETSSEGVMGAIETMIEEDEIERGSSIGIFNRETREWVLNPWLAIK